jgi:hypothetical protein
MPNFPTDIPAVRDAILVYELPEGLPTGATEEARDQVVDALIEAQSAASPVNAVVKTFDVLAPLVADLDLAGARVLAGCAHLISANAWHQKGAEALGVRDSAVARLGALGDG